MMTYENPLNIIPTTIADYPAIQNMARFYVYDLSRDYGFSSEEWAIPSDGLYESFDFKNYFEDPTRKAFLIKVNHELAGFVLLNQTGTLPETEWHMGEFFILAKFQGKGVGRQVAHQIWHTHPGLWEISVMPENKQALAFWRKAISNFTGRKYTEDIKTVDYDRHQPKRFIVSFDTRSKSIALKMSILVRHASLVDIPDMVALSYDKRRAYEKAQPQFWRYAQSAEVSQGRWFRELLVQEDHILLVAQVQDKVVGFIIGRIMKAPEVYDPGGLTLLIDDFCVNRPADWLSIGGKLLAELKDLAKAKGAIQVVVITGKHDGMKRHFLKNRGLECGSEWYVGGIV